MARTSKPQQQRAIERLREQIKPGNIIYTDLKHVSRSGMMRHINVFIMRDNEPVNITRFVADALDIRQTDAFGPLKVSGCGMDMGFYVVYSLSRTLFPDGFTCTGHECPSNDHSNGDRDYTPHQHRDGEYALVHRWM